MSPRHLPAQLHMQPAFTELFTPKLITVFREGYGWRDVRADAVSGLTVAVVALPLSMAIAIASGVSPERGPLHRDRRRPGRFAYRRQPLSDRRARGRLHWSRRQRRGAARL